MLVGHSNDGFNAFKSISVLTCLFLGIYAKLQGMNTLGFPRQIHHQFSTYLRQWGWVGGEPNLYMHMLTSWASGFWTMTPRDYQHGTWGTSRQNNQLRNINKHA